MNPDQHRVLIARMLRKIRTDALRFPFLLRDLEQETVATVVYMTHHDSGSAEAAMELIQTYHSLIMGYSPLKEPRFCVEYHDWIERPRVINRYGGWRERGLMSAFGYCMQAMTFQYSIFWHLWRVSGYTIDQFLRQREGMWLSYIFAIPDPIESDDSD